MSLQDFAKQRAGTQPTVGVSLIKDFVANRSSGITVNRSLIAGRTVAKEEQKKKLTKWQWISKQLMKPVGFVAAEAEAIGQMIGAGQAWTPGKEGLSVLAGKKETSFSRVWEDSAEGLGISKSAARKIGFVFDLTNDPLNFIGGGLTKLGKLASKVTSLGKAGKVVKAGSKLARAIKKSGYTAKQLTLAGTKAEQAAMGQRALIKVLGKPIVSGTKFYKAATKLHQVTGASKAGAALRRTFSAKTGVKGIDELVENFNNLSNYRKQKVLDTAIDIQRNVKKMDPAQVKLMVEAIENPAARVLIKDKTALKLADDMEGLFSKIKVKEKAVGVLKTELDRYFPHIKAKDALSKRIAYLFSPKQYSASLGAAKGRKIPGTIGEINKRFGKEFFQSNPALAYAQRGLASAKAVTAKEFLDDIGKKFFVNAEKAPMSFVESANPILKGLKAEPDVVRTVDKYIQGIQPEELKLIVRGFDKVQNWWKAQVLVSPSYHLRNTVGNIWNNWLAGVKNPVSYAKARLIQSKKGLNKVLLKTDAGELLTRKQVLNMAKKRGVVGKGLYGAEITQALASEIGGATKRARTLSKLAPWTQENILLKTNRKVGQAIEDNARLAHFIEMLQKGFGADDAARSVKKYLFDYADLSQTERTIFKRALPFYTWTRKNIPLQLENMIVQPEKYAAIPKIIQQIEAGVAKPKTEKYMSAYITENVPVRIRTAEDGATEYFLLGNWLPSAQAIDFLSQPFNNIVNMATPLLKTPFELWANKSMFFKNTLGEPSKIEYYYRQPTEFVGIPMRKKTAHLTRNIRILNDLNKLIKTPARNEPENSWVVKTLDVFFGKAAAYDPKQARFFYERETEDRIGELRASIKRAQKAGQPEHAKKLQEQLQSFIKERKSK